MSLLYQDTWILMRKSGFYLAPRCLNTEMASKMTSNRLKSWFGWTLWFFFLFLMIFRYVFPFLLFIILHIFPLIFHLFLYSSLSLLFLSPLSQQSFEAPLPCRPTCQILETAKRATRNWACFFLLYKIQNICFIMLRERLIILF